MAYQVLARKWRPQDFSAVVGQEPVVTALRNAVTEGRVAQAYLFSGIRGVGKTSVARIFAKALNCPERQNADPCNACATCEEITRGGALDVIEVDAATYSKVEQVRELTDSLKYGPARDRYKVVVIDEIHRLSRQAFDALLKIVEEPPAHLVFLFATTEVESVPATILSRCQEFSFRRVPAASLAQHLREIADGEKLQVSDTALRLIARAGEGSVRDAVALLDQLATYGSGAVADEEAARILGGVGADFHLALLGAILDGRSEAVSAAVRDIESEGRDPRHVFAEFLTYGRDALHLCLGGPPAALDLPADEAAALAAVVAELPYERLLRMLHLLLGSEAIVRRSEQGALAMEVALLRAAELPKVTRIEELLAGGAPRRPEATPAAAAKGSNPAAAKGSNPGRHRGATGSARRGAGRAAAAPAARPPGPSPAEPPTPAPPTSERPTPGPPASGPPAPEPSRTAAAEPAVRRPRTVAADPPPGPPVAGGGGGGGGNGASIARFLEQVSRERQPLAAHLASAEGVEFRDGVLRITAPAGDDWLQSALGRKGNRAVLEECMRAVWGEATRWHLAEGSAGGDAEPQPDDHPAEHPAQRHPAVQAALDIFGGTVESIDEGER